ncbi:Bcr/CflA family drug resistance efflux transporter, partial [Rhodobacteraceae bacterium]|nr:Bcr/CflA family drug resistance efflux transporter [Paracoccaceae bacterium]
GINWMIRTGGYIGCVGMAVAAVITMLGYVSPIVFFAACSFVGLGNGLVIPNASAGMLSVRAHLAGTMSGVGASIMIGGGAALSAFSGVMIQRGGSSLTLILIMFGSLLFGLFSILYVARREKLIDAET